jgi:hypothetical protein
MIAISSKLMIQSQKKIQIIIEKEKRKKIFDFNKLKEHLMNSRIKFEEDDFNKYGDAAVSIKIYPLKENILILRDYISVVLFEKEPLVIRSLNGTFYFNF